MKTIEYRYKYRYGRQQNIDTKIENGDMEYIYKDRLWRQQNIYTSIDNRDNRIKIQGEIIKKGIFLQGEIMETKEYRCKERFIRKRIWI